MQKVYKKETEVYDTIRSTQELNGGVCRVDENGSVFLDMPDGKVFELKGGISNSDLYGSSGFVDAMRVK
jgi:hypothetical protein